MEPFTSSQFKKAARVRPLLLYVLQLCKVIFKVVKIKVSNFLEKSFQIFDEKSRLWAGFQNFISARTEDYSMIESTFGYYHSAGVLAKFFSNF
jgi:hypothetical protein